MHKLNGSNDYHPSSVHHLANSTKVLSNQQQHTGSSYMNNYNSKPAAQIIKAPLSQPKKIAHNGQTAFKKNSTNSKENKFDHLPDI